MLWCESHLSIKVAYMSVKVFEKHVRLKGQGLNYAPAFPHECLCGEKRAISACSCKLTEIVERYRGGCSYAGSVELRKYNLFDGAYRHSSFTMFFHCIHSTSYQLHIYRSSHG